MRKNAINKRLCEIPGGVCAPAGFKANGIHSGISRDPNKKDLAIVAADRRCSVACVFSVHSSQSACACVSKKHIKNGMAQGILINSGVANVFQDNGEWICEKSCRILAQCSDIEVNETLFASTGKVGERLTIEPFEKGIPLLIKGLTSTAEGSFAAAQAIMTNDRLPKQISYSFNLGDVPCKIGAIYKGTTRVAPNMATTIAVLTTDVQIIPEMLQKALTASVRDTFNLISIDGISSPNDVVCIFANGKAGNYKIFCEDSEYDKFIYALRETLFEICKRIVHDGDKEHPSLVCKVSGTKSKPVARALAKGLINGENMKKKLLEGTVDFTSILYTINSIEEEMDFSKIQIQIGNGKKKIAIYEEGRPIVVGRELIKGLFGEDEFVLSVACNQGNFGATALGCFSSIDIS